MAKIWMHRADSFKAAERFDLNYYLSMGSTERLEIVQYLREEHMKMKKGGKDEIAEGLRRVITIVQ